MGNILPLIQKLLQFSKNIHCDVQNIYYNRFIICGIDDKIILYHTKEQ